ncbi:MAG TPA: hypothetical protein VK797_15655 [Tepidisphaeraceae bacterium]|nr:hypothetical protein [Tepidisphaeraceae bacterium]
MGCVPYKWDAEQIQRQHPHLSLAQIHSALANYYDHQAQLDAEIQLRNRAADEFFKGKENDPIALRLRGARRQSS